MAPASFLPMAAPITELSPPPMAMRGEPSSPRVPWGAVFFAFTLCGVMAIASFTSMRVAQGQPADLLRTTVATLAQWWTWAALAPLVYQVAHRFPPNGPRPVSAILVHCLVATLAVSVVTVVNVAVARWVYAAPAGESWRDWLVISVGFRVTSYYLVYTILVGLALIAETQHRLQSARFATAEVEAALTRAQLTALQLRLQPHFLFNTLHAIGMLTEEDPPRAAQMVNSLGELLRASLDTNQAQEVTLAAELELLEPYLAIEQTRFQDRLSVDLWIEPEVKSLLVPTLVLQPLVENAVRHGVAPRPERSRVTVEAVRRGAELLLTVWNDLPMAEDRPVSEGIGLSNTRTRLEHLYRGAARLTLANSDGGTAVTIAIPAHATPVF